MLLNGFMTRDELAAELKVHPRTIARWHLRRAGPPVIRLGTRPIYEVEAVRAWLSSRATP